MKNLKVVFMGTPDFAVNVLEGLIENCNVVGVVSQPDKMVGRHQELRMTAVKKCAIKNGIEVIQPVKLKMAVEKVLAFKPDIIVTCAYGQIVPEEILNYPRYGCINVHASLLPKLRGGAPIHKAIIEGYKKTGITIMYMDKKMDSGDIISQGETIISDEDNLESLHDRLSIMGKELLIKTLPNILSGSSERIKQNEEEVSYAWNIKREEEHINFDKTSREVFNQIRGLSPIPGANVIFEGQEMKVYASYISDRIFKDKKTGEISNLYKDGIGVVTKNGEVVLTDIKPFGKRRMSAVSYINGLKNKDVIGKVLE